MTNTLNPAPITETFLKPDINVTGTLQQGTGGYVMHKLDPSAFASIFDAGHLLPSKEFGTNAIPFASTRANMWNFFASNLKLLFPNHNFTMPEAQGKAEKAVSP